MKTLITLLLGIPGTITLALLALSWLPLPTSAQSITVQPANITIMVGAQQQFKAFDSTGKDISSKVTWSSTDPSVAIVGAATGTAVGMKQGTITVVATPGPGVVLPPPPPPPANQFTFKMNPTTLAFPSSIPGGALPPFQNLEVDNIGPNGTHTDWTATFPSWLALTPSSGLSKTEVAVTVKASPAGSYSGNIVIASPEAPSVTIPVTWTVTAAAPPVTITCSWDTVNLQNNCIVKNVPSKGSVKVQVNPPGGATATATRP